MRSIKNSKNNGIKQLYFEQKRVKEEIQLSNRKNLAKQAIEIRASLLKHQQSPVDQACEKGASSWLTAIPLTEFGFKLHKQAFWDALSL